MVNNRLPFFVPSEMTLQLSRPLTQLQGEHRLARYARGACDKKTKSEYEADSICPCT
jgi:hypothetical protein